MTRVYDTDGEGRWWVTEWQPQCVHRNRIYRRECQGVHEHGGEHWAYSSDGSYLAWVVGEGCSSTPPLHASWISPAVTTHCRYIEHHETSEVTDPALIARLEVGDVDDPISAPCTQEEIDELRRLGRID